MLELSMDMEQYDCPFIDTTDDHEVAFSAVQWSFDERASQLETRLVVEAADRGALDQGLSALSAHENMRRMQLLARRSDRALIRTVINETAAMAAIRDNDGYITGPFHIEDGSETWEVGFDSGHDSERALADLDRENEYTIEERRQIDLDAFFDVVQNVDTAADLLTCIRELSEVERRTLAVAADRGYFEEPRGVTLDGLAREFGVSDTAVSKNMRRAERKLLPRILAASDRLH